MHNEVFDNGDKGIEFNGATNFTAAADRVHDKAELGLHLLRPRAGMVKDNVVYRDESRGIDSHGAVDEDDGIRLGGPTEVGTLDQITVTDNRGWGDLQSGVFTKGLLAGATTTISGNAL